jgi:predicted ribosome quality control (RQC) complex YloA/Tae2 family protein
VLTRTELARAVAIVARELAGARVERVTEPDPRRVVVSLRAKGRDAHLLLCCDPAAGRLSLLALRPPAPPSPPAFAQLLRARLGGARLTGARVVDADRQAALRFEGEAGAFELLLSLLGPRSNVVLLDGEARVVGALRPLAETRRDLSLGAPWRSPATKPPPAGDDRFARETDARFFAALEAAAAEQEGARERDTLARRVERALRRAAQALDKKLALLAADAGAAGEAESLRRQGELLKGALGGVARGAREVRARDFGSGEEVVIPLDPALAPRKNVDALFARARKAEKRAERALRERGEAEARREALAALEADFAALAPDDAAALAAFAERPEVARLLARFAAEPAAAAGAPAAVAKPRRVWRLGKQELPARLAPRVYRSATGLEIWVGRSDEGNDLLSTRLARGNDLFFHLDASPGSHVVLRTEGRSDPPAEALLEAAELAVHFSKHRKATEAHVVIAPIKNVSKPRGAKPGLVHVKGGRSLRLRREAKRLERVLARREDPADEG